MVYGLPQVNEPSQVCEEWCKAKQTRKAFRHDLSMKLREKLELVHFDVCGPFEVRSNVGNCYFLIFIYELTGYMWIYLIERKGEVFTQFKKFKLHVEKQIGCKLKKLRTDGGDEYTSREFARFCIDEGIEHEVILPYTPQHNGIAERRNISLLNMTRSMLKAKEVPKRFWGEVALTTIHILNRCLTKKIVEKTPYEAWKRKNSNVSYLRVFGSMCFKHVPEKLMKKLDDQSQAMRLIDYHSTGAYKPYLPNDDKLVIIQDVLVDESKGWH